MASAQIEPKWAGRGDGRGKQCSSDSSENLNAAGTFRNTFQNDYEASGCPVLSNLLMGPECGKTALSTGGTWRIIYWMYTRNSNICVHMPYFIVGLSEF